jgi:SnoaL-like domain
VSGAPDMLSAAEVARLRLLMAKADIADVLAAWAFSRDQGDWDGLAACYHDDGEMFVSWYGGPIAGFVTGSRAMAARRTPGETSKHFIGNARIEITGDRAISECDALVLGRRTVDGAQVDSTAFIRFFDRFERRGGHWRIRRRVGVYEKDRLDPVVPGGPFGAIYATLPLESYPAACRHLCAVIGRGKPMNPDIVSAATPEERKLKSEAASWLAEGGR